MLAFGPYLYPQTMTYWVKVVGRQLGWSSADFSFQYACCILSSTASKSQSHIRSADVDHHEPDEGVDVWALLSAELSSCVRRMKPEHTRALCLIIGGATIPATPGYSGCEMLFPSGPVPDHGAAAAIGAIHAAVLKLANSTAVGTPVISPLLSASSPYTLSTLQAKDLLDSVAHVKDFIAAVHNSLPSSSSRKALMSCCLDSRKRMHSELVLMLCSPMGKDKAVVKVGNALILMRGEVYSGEDNTAANEAIQHTEEDQIKRKEVKEMELEAIIIRLSIDLISDLIRPPGAPTAALGVDAWMPVKQFNAFSVSSCLVANAHSNFGLSVLEGVTRALCALAVSLSSNTASSATPTAMCVCVEDKKFVTPRLDIIDNCIAVADVCQSYLSGVCNSLPGDPIITRLKGFIATEGAHTQDLLTTRRVLSQILSFSPSSLGPATHDVEIVTSTPQVKDKESSNNPYKTTYSLDSNADKSALFKYLTVVSTALPGVHATVTARSLVQLLRCWGLSRAGGSIKQSLEAPIPQGNGSHFLSSIILEPLESSFRLTCWSAVIPLLEKEDPFFDVLHIIIVDLVGSSDVLSDIIVPLVKNTRMPKNVQLAVRTETARNLLLFIKCINAICCLISCYDMLSYFRYTF